MSTTGCRYTITSVWFTAAIGRGEQRGVSKRGRRDGVARRRRRRAGAGNDGAGQNERQEPQHGTLPERKRPSSSWCESPSSTAATRSVRRRESRGGLGLCGRGTRGHFS